MRPTAARVVGVDAARCVALVAMMATHVLPGIVDGEVTVAQQLAGGRSSALFAVLAGVSLTLATGSRQPLRGRAWRGALAATAARAAVIALVGLALGELDTGIAVILVYYAVLFLVVAPFLALRTSWLLATAGVWAVVAPVVSLLLRRRVAPTSYDVPSFGSLDEPLVLLRDLLLTGYYPALTWVPYLLLGVTVGRLDLRSGRVMAWLAVAGWSAVATAVVVSDALTRQPEVRAALVRSFIGAGWRGDLDTTLTHGLYGVTPTGSGWWLAVRAPHSGTTPDLLMTAGSACLVLAACLVVGRSAPRVAAVVFGAGAMTFTLYSAHVALRTEGWWDGDDTATFAGQVAVVLAVGAAFRLLGWRGPLEAVAAVAGSAGRRAVGARRIGSRP